MQAISPPGARLDEAALARRRAAKARARRQFRSNGRVGSSPAAQKGGRGASGRSRAAAWMLATRSRDPADREGAPPSRAEPREAARASSFAELKRRLSDYGSRDRHVDPSPTWRAVKLWLDNYIIKPWLDII